MEEKSNEATPLRPEGDRTLDAPIVSFDLSSFMRQIKEEATWTNSDRNAITLFKSNGMRLVLVALHAGAKMNTHIAEGIISAQVLEGRMIFDTAQQSVELTKGQMLALHKGLPHSIAAIEETIFLLTLALGNK